MAEPRSNGGGAAPVESIFDQAERILAEQDANSARVAVTNKGVEAGVKKGLPRGWSIGAWMRWLRGERAPTVAAEAEKRWLR